MSNKKVGLFGALLFISPFAFAVTSCSSSGNYLTLRVLNSDDYIYINAPKDGYNEPDLIEQFADAYKEKYQALGYDGVKVIYDVSDTNESIYNDLLTGRIKYDLVNTSEYMVQKFIREDLITPLNYDLIPNYNDYASPFIRDRVDQISVNLADGTTKYLKDYVVGYMWGTLGLLINPEYSAFVKNNIDFDQVINDAQSFDILWNEAYRKTASIKNSMRDTYAIALLHGYDEQMQELKIRHDNGEIDDDTYSSEISKIFNRTDDDTLNLVIKELKQLKDNVFGLEVDSGKLDIITKKIGINTAWSGDAMYSIDRAEDPEVVGEGNECELYYAVPENGSNVWSDCWSMPVNKDRSEDVLALAHDFLNYLCDPEIASKNIDYTGYTSFIGGDTVLDLYRDWYDARTDLIYEYDEEAEEDLQYRSLFYQIDDEWFEVWYEDCHFESESDPYYDNIKLYSGFAIYDEDENIIDFDGELRDINETYNERLIISEEWEEVDLSYFFDGTLEGYAPEDMVFYSDCYLPFESDGNISVGRQFFAQFPSKETILRCSVMEDYGDNNIKVVKLWENFKSNPLPIWAIILISIEAVIIVSAIVYIFFGKRIKKKLRILRTSQNNKLQ